MIKSYRIGVMQGRLLPKYMGRYQAHPVGHWQKEFYLAKKLGIDLIEFILDFDGAEQNPLMIESGINEIAAISEHTGVNVKSVCADYFMEAPLHSSSTLVADGSQKIIEKLVVNASKIGIQDIIIPCVDQSSIRTAENRQRLIERLRDILGLAKMKGINLALETDLPPHSFADLLEKIGSSRITVNYDTGNSAALGYDPIEELMAYGNSISDIHIKDRIRGGGSVMLGTGAVDFDRFFFALAKTNYSGPFVLQTYRDEEGVEIFEKQLAWIIPKIKKWWLNKEFK